MSIHIKKIYHIKATAPQYFFGHTEILKKWMIL